MRKTILFLSLATPLLLAGAATAQTKVVTKGPVVDIDKAVKCQTMIIQFNDRIAASKASDDAKKAARDSLAAGNKACNEKSYDAGLTQVRQALATIEVKPLY